MRIDACETERWDKEGGGGRHAVHVRDSLVLDTKHKTYRIKKKKYNANVVWE